MDMEGVAEIMSNKIFQNAISQMREIAPGREIGVIDENSVIVACNNHGKIGSRSEFYALERHEEDFDAFTRDGYTYKPFVSIGFSKNTYAVFVEGTSEETELRASMIAVTLALIKQHHDEKYDRGNFVKNIILDNVLPGDINIKSRELQFNPDITRVVFLISIAYATDISAFEIVQNLFPDRNRDFVFNISETDIVLVKELKNNTESKDLEKLARSISDTLSGEFFSKVSVGIGGQVLGIRELARSFKEAQIALEVGKVFDTDKRIICYAKLGIARLIYHLPTTLCGTFLMEVFNRGSIESLDHETLFTIQKFFENNLNVSETSRKLFVHRNTLVYRLDKIKKLTGLDLREFEDAIVFKIALMVRKFLSNNPMKY